MHPPHPWSAGRPTSWALGWSTSYTPEPVQVALFGKWVFAEGAKSGCQDEAILALGEHAPQSNVRCLYDTEEKGGHREGPVTEAEMAGHCTPSQGWLEPPEAGRGRTGLPWSLLVILSPELVSCCSCCRKLVQGVTGWDRGKVSGVRAAQPETPGYGM